MKVRGARFFLALLLLLTLHMAGFRGRDGKSVRTGFHSREWISHDSRAVAEASIINHFLFCFDWLKINVGFVLGISEPHIIHLLPGIAPSKFSIVTCASSTKQSLRSETSDSSLPPPFPSPPITMSLQARIYLVKCVLEFPLPFHPSCSALILDLIVLRLYFFNRFLFWGRNGGALWKPSL